MYSMRILPSLAFMIIFCSVSSESTDTKPVDGFKQTIANNRMPETTRKEMQHELLELHQIQNPTEIKDMEMSATQYMLELYKIRIGEKYERPLMGPKEPDVALHNSHFPDIHDIHRADVIMSFVNDAHKPDFLERDRDHLVYFDLHSVSSDHILSKAVLRLYKVKRTKSKYRVVLYRLRRRNGMEDETVMPETNVMVSGDCEGWISINVTDAANYWKVNRNENFGLDIQVTDVETGQICSRVSRQEVDPKKSGIRIYEGPKRQQPFMTVFVKEKDGEHVWRTSSEQRARRSASQQGGNKECKKHPLYINFTTLGWTHVIAPLGYNAFYCAGECNYNPGANVTSHSTIQSLLNLNEPNKIPKPCCSPSKLSQGQVLYKDKDNTFILKYYQDMVVEACGCF